MDFVFLCLLCHGSGAVRVRPLPKHPHPAPASSGSPFSLGLLSRALSGKLGVRLSGRIQPPRAQRSRPRAPAPRHRHHQVALPLTEGRGRAGPQTHLVQLPGQSSPERFPINAKIGLRSPLSTPTDDRVICPSPQGALSSYSVVFQDCLGWLQFL